MFDILIHSQPITAAKLNLNSKVTKVNCVWHMLWTRDNTISVDCTTNHRSLTISTDHLSQALQWHCFLLPLNSIVQNVICTTTMLLTVDHTTYKWKFLFLFSWQFYYPI